MILFMLGFSKLQCCKQWSGPVTVWERSVRGLFHTDPALNSDTLLQRLGWVWSPNVSTTKPSLTQVLLWQGSVLWKERPEGFSQQRAWRQAEPSVSVLFLSEALMYIYWKSSTTPVELEVFNNLFFMAPNNWKWPACVGFHTTSQIDIFGTCGQNRTAVVQQKYSRLYPF